MKLGENNYHMRLSFSPSFMKIGQKIGFFNNGQFFNVGPFFYLDFMIYLFCSLVERREKERVKIGGMESENKRRSRILLSRSRSRSPLRSKQIKKKGEVSPSRTEKKWTHDKFQETLNR